MNKFLISLLFLSPMASAQLSLQGADYVSLLDLSGRSCQLQVESFNRGDDDLAPVKAVIGGLRLRWSGDSEVSIASMKVIFEGDRIQKGYQEIELSQQEISHLWGNYGETVTIRPYRDITTTPFCKFMVGGVKLNNTSEYFEDVGIIEVIGHYVDRGVSKLTETRLYFRYHLTPLR